MAGDPFALSTTAASNTTIDSVSIAEGMDPGKVNDAIRQFAANYACFVGDVSGALLAAGSANARTVTANSTYSTYANGRIITARIPAVNTGSATLNVNGIGAKQVRLQTPTGDVALSGGEMNGTHTFLYLEAANSAAGGWILLNPNPLQKWAKGADLASASTLTLGTDGNYFDVTGTTTITAISSMAAGSLIRLKFEGALTLTHNSTSLILPWGQNIPTQNGDVAEFVSEGSGNWRCTSYSPETRYGSGSNGHYVRHLDGTQRCWIRLSSSSIALNNSYGSIPLYYGEYTWTFPVAFSNNPTVTCGEFKWGASASWPGSPTSPSTTGVTLRGMDTASRASGTATLIAAEAVGRWF